MKYNILLADDDASIRFVLSKYLTRAGYGVKATDNPHTLVKWVEAGEGDMVLTDVHMGAEEIFSYIPALRSLRPELPIIVISANTRMVTALKSRQSGVHEYIPKPFELPDLEKAIRRALDTNIKPQPLATKKPDQMIGRSKAMQPVFRAISDFASGNVPVFIWGGAGTGKNLAVQCLHDSGGRASMELVHFSGLNTVSDILAKVGNGDLFVDRVHELPATYQALLLQILEQNEARAQREQFRVITTAEISIEDIQKNQMVRTDLLSHIMGGRIFLPNLQDRGEDIADLAAHFLNTGHLGGHKNINKAAQVRLKAHTWPGNIRELRNLMQVIALQFSGQNPSVNLTADQVERMLAPHDNTGIQNNPFDDIKLACAELLSTDISNDLAEQYTHYEQALEWVERPLIAEALRITGGNNSKAADLLGIHRNTLRTKLRKWGQKGC